ncbi:Bromo-adjacent domain-containing protein [Heracleum sosnowskyi]|uniref:Bromo-adjacent domain-containing protein n=1 Tax=Heracleum sosnowskyi TaxID=360622 RepID=A0AAD8MIY5_9APIA|nr:Bromo-adjacent domain-containing protein [Heracleum sosnowskyi]
MDLEFEKFCVIDGSPNTVLPCPRQFSRVEREKTSSKPHETLSPKQGFSDITFRRYRSASCKRSQPRSIVLEGNKVLKRGSVYQSSQEVTMRDLGDVGDRRKIEFPQSSVHALSLGVLDSLCASDDDSSSLEHRSSVISLKSELSTSVSKPYSSKEFISSSCQPISKREVSLNSFLKISLESEDRKNQSAEYVKIKLVEASMGSHDLTFGLPKDDSGLKKRDSGFVRQNSLSAERVLPCTPLQSQSNCSMPSTLTSRFSPTRKTFEPFPKSQSQRSHVGSVSERTTIKKFSISRKKRSQRSLLPDFTKTSGNTCDSQIVKECNKPPTPCSPAHLHGHLKLKNKHGMPFFEFSVKSPEDKIIAKTWKVGNAMNWLYTFHTSQSKSRAKSSGWGIKESNKESSMVGQMQVSCLLRSDLKDAGALENSMVTEFVLYDIKQAIKDIAAQKNSFSSPEVAKPPTSFKANLAGGTCKLHETSDQIKNNDQPKNGNSPWEPADLHPNHEIAAIVIQVPLEKRESLKEKRRNQKNNQYINLHDLRGMDQRTDCLTPVKVNVVTCSGTHGLPTTNCPGPSRLLDRWKFGGGCDCGGWDMGCPVVAFDNSRRCSDEHSTINNQKPWKLYIQGGKEKSPALRMTVTNDGEYEVDFHAQLTTLQAFSICVSILHSTEATDAVGQSTDENLLQCDSLSALLDEDVKYIFETVEEDKKKAPTSFVLNPPFSPIARV